MEEGIHREHRATEVCGQALYYLAGMFPPAKKDAPVAIGGAMEGDPYKLASLMASTCLGAMGWNAVNLGADLPFSALESAVAFHTPRVELAWLSCNVAKLTVGREKEPSRLVGYLGALGVELVVGGRGWSFAGLPAGGVRYAASMRELTAFAAGLGKGRMGARV